MKCKKQPCTCHNDRYVLLFRGFHIISLYGVKCQRCKRVYKIKSLFPHMSLEFIDVILKIVLILSMIYYAILGFLPGVIYMFALILLPNIFIYPLLFKIGIMIIERKEGKREKRT